MVISLERGADCLHMVQLMPKTPSSLASFESSLVSPVWYRLTQVVVENRLLNTCRCSSSSIWFCASYVCISVFACFVFQKCPHFRYNFDVPERS